MDDLSKYLNHEWNIESARVPSKYPWLYPAVSGLSQAGKTRLALELAKAGFDLDPQPLESLVLIGLAYQQAGNDKAAEALFKKVLSVDPEHNIALKSYGLLLLKRKRLNQEAVNLLLRYLEANPTDSFVLEKLSGSLNRARETQKAEDVLRSAWNSCSTEEEVKAVGTLFADFLSSSGGKPEEAINVYKTVAERNKSYDAAFAAGLIALQIHDYSAAKAAFQYSIDLGPQADDAYLNYGYLSLALQELDQYHDALNSANKSIELNPTDSLFWSVKVKSLIELNHYEEARSAAEQALHQDDLDDYDLPNLYLFLAQAYSELGENTTAIKTLVDVVNKYPEIAAKAMQVYISLMLDHGMFYEAFPLLDAIIEKEEDVSEKAYASVFKYALHIWYNELDKAKETIQPFIGPLINATVNEARKKSPNRSPNDTTLTSFYTALETASWVSEKERETQLRSFLDQYYSILIGLLPGLSRLVIVAAEYYLDYDNYEQAENILIKGMDSFKENYDFISISSLLGYVYLIANKFDLAEDVLKTAEASLNARRDRGGGGRIAFFVDGKIIPDVRKFGRSAAKSHIFVLGNLATIMAAKGELEKAVDYIAQCLTADNINSAGYELLGFFFYNQKNWQAAEAAWNQAAKLNENQLSDGLKNYLEHAVSEKARP